MTKRDRNRLRRMHGNGNKWCRPRRQICFGFHWSWCSLWLDMKISETCRAIARVARWIGWYRLEAMLRISGPNGDSHDNTKNAWHSKNHSTYRIFSIRSDATDAIFPTGPTTPTHTLRPMRWTKYSKMFSDVRWWTYHNQRLHVEPSFWFMGQHIKHGQCHTWATATFVCITERKDQWTRSRSLHVYKIIAHFEPFQAVIHVAYFPLSLSALHPSAVAIVHTHG